MNLIILNPRLPAKAGGRSCVYVPSLQVELYLSWKHNLADIEPSWAMYEEQERVKAKAANQASSSAEGSG